MSKHNTYKNANKKTNKNEIVIKSEEIDDYVDLLSSSKISEIYYLIKEECRFNSLPILDNPTHNSYGDFIDLILDCVNTNQIYKDNNKIDF
jgi:hypothetical protein